MPRASAATEDDWALIRAVWEAGGSLTACSEAVDGRAARSTVKRRAETEDWVRPDGTKQVIPVEVRQTMARAANEARRAVWAEERERIVSRLIEVTDDALDDMKRPTVVKEAKVVSGGQGMPSSVEVVEIEYDQAPIGERKNLMTIAQVAIEKLQLLTGEATGRTESVTLNRDAVVTRAKQLRDEIGERRRAKEIQDAQASTVEM